MKNLALKQDMPITQINNKFGLIEIDLNEQLNFPQGLMGMPKAKKFCLANCPIKKFESFKILQSLDDQNLVFLVLPFCSSDENFIREEDIANACLECNIERNEALILLIASAKTIDSEKVITVNLRAPLLVDTKKHKAFQTVFLNEDYSIQHIY